MQGETAQASFTLPYFLSPTIGCPMPARCTRIWFFLPVSKRTSSKAKSFVCLSTR